MATWSGLRGVPRVGNCLVYVGPTLPSRLFRLLLLGLFWLCSPLRPACGVVPAGLLRLALLVLHALTPVWALWPRPGPPIRCGGPTRSRCLSHRALVRRWLGRARRSGHLPLPMLVVTLFLLCSFCSVGGVGLSRVGPRRFPPLELIVSTLVFCHTLHLSFCLL